MINDAKLDFWLQNDLNVLLTGLKGVGKSSMIIQACKRNNIEYMYYSAATMDIFSDFIGIPKVKIDSDGSEYIEYIKPKRIRNNNVQLLIFDEFNRGTKRVVNSVMELVQFKSINGEPLSNLRMVWAAINPPDDEDSAETYSVEALDPAHLDRFHVQVDVPYKCDREFFNAMFGENGKIGVDWWEGLDKKIKYAISPRRLEYALAHYKIGGDLNDIIPKKSGANLSQLTIQLKNGSFEKRLAKLYTNKNDDATKTALLNENFFKGVEELILKKKEYIEYFGYHYPSEKFNQMIITNDKFRNTILTNTDKLADISDQLKTIVDAGAAKQSILKELKNILNKNNLITAGSLEALFAEFYEIDDPFGGRDAKLNRLTIAKILYATDYEKIKYSQAIKAIAMNCGLVACTIGTIWAQSVQAFEKQAAALDDPSIGGFAAVYEQDVKLDKFFIKHVATDKDKLFKLEAHLTKRGYLK